MNHQQKVAVGKMVFGTGQVISGAVTVAGGGLLCGIARGTRAMPLFRGHGIQTAIAGKKQIVDGVALWKRASRGG